MSTGARPARDRARDARRGNSFRQFARAPPRFSAPRFHILVRLLLALVLLADVLAGPLTPAQALWVYVTLGASAIVTEELAPILGGLAASQGELAFTPVVVAVTVGGWVATTLLYALGRWRGRWIRRRFPRAGAAMKRLLRAVRRRPWRSAFLVRFAFGLRLLLPLACGAAHVRPDVYLVSSFLGSATWSAAFVGVGYWFGDAAVSALGQVRRYDQYVVAVAAGFAVVAWLTFRHRRRVRAAAGGPAEPPR